MIGTRKKRLLLVFFILMLGSHSSSCVRSALRMDANERRKVLQEHFSKRRHRRDKPGRAFENVYYTFDVLGNLGLYRDLHRHRILTQERQRSRQCTATTRRREIEEAGFKTRIR